MFQLFSSTLTETQVKHRYTRHTGAVGAAVLLTVCWVKSEVELTPEEGTIVGVDQLKHALVDDVRLKAEQYKYELRKKKSTLGLAANPLSCTEEAFLDRQS